MATSQSVPPWRVCTFSETLVATPTLRETDSARVDELAGAGDQADGAHLLVEVVDGARDLEGELRDAVAEGGERHALEHDVGEAAIGGRVARAFLGLDQRVGELVLAADVEAPGEVREVELGAVGPDAADAGDRTLGEGDGEVGEVAVLDAGLWWRAVARRRRPCRCRRQLPCCTTSSSIVVAQMIWPPRRARP